MTRPLIHIDREACLQLERSMTREWLETDGRGGYASSTILMCPTRRYHGLLVAPPPDSTKRHVFLSRFEETLIGGGKSVPISMARYRGCGRARAPRDRALRAAPYPVVCLPFGTRGSSATS